jgi:multiple antibiotic resistance protein
MSTKIEKVLGSGGIAILRKVFGIILLAIAIKLFRTNVGF